MRGRTWRGNHSDVVRANEVTTTLAVQFPLGRYHANPWDRAVNEGATEWPPSPWRILRALVATWHTRWPELPATTIDTLLDALGDPPCFRTPRTHPAHTRHYMPGLEHKKGEQGETALTLDPFLSIPADQELLIRWDVHLTAEMRSALGKLAELLPYLGRSESVCRARLLDEETELDESWWRPRPGGQTRRLAVARPVTRVVLEVTTTDVRRQRRTVPPGTTWVSYAAGGTADPAADLHRDAGPGVAAIRFAVMGPVAMKATHGVLLADRAHEMAGTALTKAEVPNSRRRDILGTDGASADHLHAHWIALPDSRDRGASIRNLVVWVKRELRTDEVQALLGLRQLSGRLGKYQVSGFPEVHLLFQAAGPVEQVVPELSVTATRWVSCTPYLPVRHRKRRQTPDEYLAADVRSELGYRGFPAAAVSRSNPGSGLTDRWASEFRRYRIHERLAREELVPADRNRRRTSARPGLGLRLEFEEPVTGPLLLGQLSHFGYGIFVPEPS